ncbi:hypothetical protein O1611_g9602 [Lasiodiplodia mahajangana]|uniref:Uncharacterized protein n=1 Tax=Lasiodiplodia mahajangana TaxID=1108764 RepID=A0ACC2J7M1_9PEZI|nr:hypothetical protein O1611_g9602 [Lasiodiplodia mahajangana]
MGLSSIFPAALGVFALLATAVILALEVIIAYWTWPSTSPARIIAVIASASEAIVLIFLVTKLAKYVRGTDGHRSRDLWSAWFALDLLASVLASAVSVALLIVISNAKDLPKAVSNVPLANLQIGSAVALAFAFISQLFFIVVYFVLHRLPDSEQALSLHTNEEGRLSPQLPMRIKSVPYDRTKPAVSQTRLNDRGSSEYASRPGTSSGRSAAETITSFSGSLSNIVRPMGSRTRLLSSSSKSGQRLGSFDSNAFRDRISVTEDGFDSWDTSSVDPHNRQMVLETSSPVRPRFLETIPASPTTSRSPSPGCPLDLEPPKRGRRNRSDSPIRRAQQERAYMPSESELHIHPLFRSDSPGPPPPTTPGTVVVAAPNAGQFITGKSVNRMRSCSSPNSSPLSRQGSYESFGNTASLNGDSLRPDNGNVEERKMTPPIPDWVLNAGSRSSLAEYYNKERRG